MNPTPELYASLEEAYEFFNKSLFEGQLPTIIFTVQRQKGVMGYFAPDRWGTLDGSRCHEIAINPSYIANSCLIDVLQTLVHEMAHCWQHCFGRPGRGHYHNKEWAKKMISIGLMPSTTGVPGGAITGQCMSDYLLEGGQFAEVYHELKIRKGFQLKWIDRIAANKTFDPAFYNAPIESVTESSGEVDNLMEEASEPTTSFQSDYMPLKIDDEQTFAELAPEKLFIPAPIKSKTSKTKYTCSSCKINIWGKPSLKVVCGECNNFFEEA